MDKSQVNGDFYDGEYRSIKSSSLNSEPYEAIMYRKEGYENDPWISLEDHFTARENRNIIYVAGWEVYTDAIKYHNGADVYIRKSNQRYTLSSSVKSTVSGFKDFSRNTWNAFEAYQESEQTQIDSLTGFWLTQ